MEWVSNRVKDAFRRQQTKIGHCYGSFHESTFPDAELVRELSRFTFVFLVRLRLEKIDVASYPEDFNDAVLFCDIFF